MVDFMKALEALDTEIALYPEGVYNGCVTEQGLGKSSREGTPFFFLSFMVWSFADGVGRLKPFPDGAKEYKRTSYLYFTETLIDSITEDLLHIGFSGTSFRELDPRYWPYRDFKGQNIQFECQHGTYEGPLSEKSERWSIYRERSGCGDHKMEPLSVSATRNLDTLYGVNLRAVVQLAERQ